MLTLLIFLLALYQLQTSIHSEIVKASQYPFNSLISDEQPHIKNQPQQQQQQQLLQMNDKEFMKLLRDNLSDNNGEPDEKKMNNLIVEQLDVNGIPYIKASNDTTELEFKHPITSLNIDYAKNLIIFKFRTPDSSKRPLTPEQFERMRAMQENFIRFGRASGDFLRFGKRKMETNAKAERYERSSNGDTKFSGRDARGDNFMRFGRATAGDFMRFGRASAGDFMRFGRSGATRDFMRLGRAPANDFMRFGRAPVGDFMRFGRSGAAKDFMRLGRGGGPNDFMRFGRGGDDFMRFGRHTSNTQGRGTVKAKRFDWDTLRNFIRFDRSPDDNINDDERPSGRDFMRSDRSDEFMRFGRIPDNEHKATSQQHAADMDDKNAVNKILNQTKKPSLQKSDVKAAAKFLKATEPDGDESNPMDKAIEVLFSEETKDDSNASNEIEY